MIEFARLAYGHAATDEAKDGEFNIIENELLLTPGVGSDKNVKEYGLTEKLLNVCEKYHGIRCHFCRVTFLDRLRDTLISRDSP